MGLFQKFERLESDDETGIIALESPLDTAVRVLDYRLLLATDNIMHTIYTYQISLLKEKIAKIHKRFVTSPVSVSPNKYTSLVVEDVGTQYAMDCADTTASFVSPSVLSSATVPSMGVPKSGLAPDTKRGVLNSRVLINGQKFPSLASSDSESPANDLEVGFLAELRRTVTMECEVRILVRVQGPVNTIEVKALLDSSATGCFVDKSWALDRHLQLSKLVKPVPILNVDGTRIQEGDITHYVLLILKSGFCCSGPRGQKSCGNLSRCSSYCIRVVPVVTTTSEYV